MKTLSMGLVLMLAQTLASAHEVPTAPAQALPLVPDVREGKLRDLAHRETTAGAILLPTGLLLVGAGAGLIISGICWHEDGRCSPGQDASVFSGLAMTVIGYPAIFSGIGTLIAGGVHRHKANRIAAGLARFQLGATPLIARDHSTGVLATGSVRF